MRTARLDNAVSLRFRPVLGIPLLLLAGCLEPREPGAGPLLPAPLDESLNLAPPLNIGAGADAESSIDLTPDGQVILVCSHGGFTQASPLWASTDGGTTFKRIEPQPNQPFNGDCDVSIAPDGTWSIVYDTVYSATVAVSTDRGATWKVSFVTGFPIAGLDRPWIHALNRNTLYMTYKSVGGGQPEVDVFAVSNDAGTTWAQKPYFLPQPPGRNSAIPGDMIVYDGGKTIRVPFTVSGPRGAPETLEYAVSRDSGATWTYETIATVPTASGIPGGARAPDGTLYFSYSNRTSAGGGTGDVLVAWSRDDGRTWSPPTSVASQQAFAGLLGNVWVDARPDGSATLFWVQRVADNGTTKWQHYGARINVSEGLRVDAVLPVGPKADPHPRNLYEFATVRHDGQGRAYFAFPSVTSASCKQTPNFPSQVGSQDIARNTACQYVVIEADVAPG